MKDWRVNWDTDMLRRFGSDKGIDWQFVMPYSQHQNGAVEIMIKLIKGITRSLMKAMGDAKLTYNEMHTLFLEVAQLCNERPIGLKPNEQTDPEYLSPNSLYLGRASDQLLLGLLCQVIFLKKTLVHLQLGSILSKQLRINFGKFGQSSTFLV